MFFPPSCWRGLEQSRPRIFKGVYLSLRFEHSQSLTIGVELELQLLDRDSLDLSSSSLQVLELLKGVSSFRAEIYQSMIEVTTDICQDAHQVGRDLRSSMSKLFETFDKLNLWVSSAGTHPFAKYENGIIFPEARYKKALENHQWIAKRLLIFGLHVHIGMKNGNHAILVANALLHYLPLFLALSSSSPFCNGEDTQLVSSRTTFFEALPTGGHPCTFESWIEFKSVYDRLLNSGSISCPKDLWWDIRPSPGFGTIEIRICDSPATIKETEAIVALIHLVCLGIDKKISSGQSFPAPPYWLLRENKWRAVRKGIHAELIVAEDGQTMWIGEFLNETLNDLSFFIEENNYSRHVDLLKQIVRHGTSADRQRLIYQRSGSFEFVLNSLVNELKTDQPQWDRSTKHDSKKNKKKGGTQCA